MTTCGRTDPHDAHLNREVTGDHECRGVSHHCIDILAELRDSLPTGHPEKPGVIRAIELLRSEVKS